MLSVSKKLRWLINNHYIDERYYYIQRNWDTVNLRLRLSSEYIKQLYDAAIIVNDQIKDIVCYEDKIDKREERHAVSFGRYDDQQSEDYYTGISTSKGIAKTININKSKDLGNRPSHIMRTYDLESKPGSEEYKYSPEEIYLELDRQKLITNILKDVWPLLTTKEKELVYLMQIRKPAKCPPNCTYYTGTTISVLCERFRFSECKYRPERYILDCEIAEMLGVTKSAISKMLNRLKNKVTKNYLLNTDDKDFIFA
jgi:hypothetical protein